MPLTHHTGDIFDTKAQVIGHGINCRGAMASGIALNFANRFPDMEMAYRHLCSSSAIQPGDVFIWQDEKSERWIYNLATQIDPGADARLTLVKQSLTAALDSMVEDGLTTLALPRIGSGVGGLDWDDVLVTITNCSVSYPDITIEIWTYNG